MDLRAIVRIARAVQLRAPTLLGQSPFMTGWSSDARPQDDRGFLGRLHALRRALRRPLGCSGVGTGAMVGLLMLWEFLAPSKQPVEYSAALVIALVLSAILIPMAFAFSLEAARQLWHGGRRSLCWAPIAALGSCMIGFPWVVETLAFSRPAVIWSFFAGLATSTVISAVSILKRAGVDAL